MENIVALVEELVKLPNETEWVEFKHSNYNEDMIGEDISALASVASTLKYLDIQTCGKIKDFSVIESLENLEVLYLYGSNSVPDLN